MRAWQVMRPVTLYHRGPAAVSWSQRRCMFNEADFDPMKLVDKLELEGHEDDATIAKKLHKVFDEQHAAMRRKLDPLLKTRLYREYDKAVDAEIKRLDAEFMDRDLPMTKEVISEFNDYKLKRVEEVRKEYSAKLSEAEYWPQYVSDEELAKMLVPEKSADLRYRLKRGVVKFNWLLKRSARAKKMPQKPAALPENASLHVRVQHKLKTKQYEWKVAGLPPVVEGPFYLANNIRLQGLRSDEQLTKAVVLDQVKKRTPKGMDGKLLKMMREDAKQIE